jgi:hypothetical protein
MLLNLSISPSKKDAAKLNSAKGLLQKIHTLREMSKRKESLLNEFAGIYKRS